MILYNLGIGATAKDLKWVYENDDAFEAIPTFGVVPGLAGTQNQPLDWLPNFNPVRSEDSLTEVEGRIKA